MLTPLSWVYGAGTMIRNAAYDLQILRSITPSVPVIAVGNLTAGGTGKTPIVGWITRYLLTCGLRPVIISRGYGRRSQGVRVVSDGNTVLVQADEGGDEPVQLAQTFPMVPVVVGERRTEAASMALEKFRPDVLILDDAFQHRAIGRHLNVMVVDASADLTREPLLPAGRRRERLQSLRRASLMVFTHVHGSPGTVEWEPRLRHWYGGEIVYSTRRITSFRSSSGHALDPDACRGKRCVLLSGIGKPRQFEDDVRGLGITVVKHLRYRDHFRYSLQEIETMVGEAGQAGAELLLTTEKDMMRLAAVEGALSRLESAMEVFAAVLEVHVSPAGRFEAHIDACVRRAA